MRVKLALLLLIAFACGCETKTYRVITLDGKEYRNLSIYEGAGSYHDKSGRVYRFQGTYTVIEEAKGDE